MFRSSPFAFAILYWVLVLALALLGVWGLWVYRAAVRNLADPEQARHVLHVATFSLCAALFTILLRHCLQWLLDREPGA